MRDKRVKSSVSSSRREDVKSMCIGSLKAWQLTLAARLGKARTLILTVRELFYDDHWTDTNKGCFILLCLCSCELLSLRVVVSLVGTMR